MHFRPAVKILVLVFAIILAVSAFAASNSATISLSKPAMVSGQQLAAGEYKVTWSGTGDNVEVKLAKGKDVVTAKAKFVETPSKNRHFGYYVDQTGALKALYIRGANQALSF